MEEEEKEEEEEEDSKGVQKEDDRDDRERNGNAREIVLEKRIFFCIVSQSFKRIFSI